VIRAGLGLLFLSACDPVSVFRCQKDEQCHLQTPQAEYQGRCESSGYCSFSDPSCPSGRRYFRYSGDLGNACLEDGGVPGG
jgi:hypothetical protein